MSIIEQAAKRLAELQRAGVTIPWTAPGLAQTGAGAVASAAPALEPQATMPVAKEVMAPALPKHSVTIDLDRLEQAGYLVPSRERSELAQQFRGIKSPLLKNARRGSSIESGLGSLIMVTSAMPGEGKTFCAVNLAMSMAMGVDTSVVLVDADVMRPALLSRMGLEGPTMGLLDLLTDQNLQLPDVLLGTNVPKLSILPAGTPNARAPELLGSQTMEQLLSLFVNQYSDCIVIFDAPPLLLTTEARVLASRVGQILMVVEAWQTSHKLVNQAFAAVENCPVVMSILNKCAPTSKSSHYGYYFG